jgi:hypothetical protein
MKGSPVRVRASASLIKPFSGEERRQRTGCVKLYVKLISRLGQLERPPTDRFLTRFAQSSVQGWSDVEEGTLFGPFLVGATGQG